MIPIEAFKENYNSVLESIHLPDKIRIKNYPISFFDRVLGHFECFGYVNKVSGSKRICSALIQAIIASTTLYLLSHFIFFPDISICSDQGACYESKTKSRINKAKRSVLAIPEAKTNKRPFRS